MNQEDYAQHFVTIFANSYAELKVTETNLRVEIIRLNLQIDKLKKELYAAENSGSNEPVNLD